MKGSILTSRRKRPSESACHSEGLLLLCLSYDYLF